MRKPGFARSRPKPSADPSAALVAAVLLTAGSAAAQQSLQPFEIVGDSIPGSLARAVGDPARGRVSVLDRRLGVDGLTLVGAAWRGKPILTAEQIDDVVAFLSTLRD
jgi:hypothetical protein